ncbi:iron chelate uptake ABC transporter family permease subunit [Neisseriaceae bacterium ESL0693]|nr:iron chelate uptake ABC transporter family permease subunit [Neisseriaceae bacterium ESL0693]
MLRSVTLTKINLLLLPILIVISLSIGVATFHWQTLFSHADTDSLLFTSRIPRTAAIVLTGATLAVAGMVLQIVLRNRFIEPNMVGATQSAGLGILLITLIWPQAAMLLKMGAASLFALLGMSVFLLLFRRLPPHKQIMMPLIGIIYGSIIEALVNFIGIETDTMQMLSVWFAGDFSAVLSGRYELLWLTGLMALMVYFLADRLTIAGLGHSISTSLGINYMQMMWFALIVVAMITAIVVVTVGQIPFIGLVVPNIVSRLAGDRLRQNLPSVALLGANALLFCDIISRTIDPPYEIPVSLIFGIVGTVLFLYLLFRKSPAHAV